MWFPMPTNKKTLGYALMACGLAVLFFTLYEAYVLYVGFTQGSLLSQAQTNSAITIPQSKVTPANNASAVESQLSQSIVSGMTKAFPVNEYFDYVLAVLLLGVFANVGYKLVTLGIAMNKS